jgi:ParB family chromosome partitioning protein
MPARTNKKARRRALVPPVRRAAGHDVLDPARPARQGKATRAEARSSTDAVLKDECYTPGEHMALVREVIGDIDCDPASCAAANRIVRAKRFYTIAQNGLEQPWFGTLWLNYPYSRPKVWVVRLLEAYDSGAVAQAMVLTNARTDSGWFDLLAQRFWRCETFSRIAFWGPGTNESGTGWLGQCFFYLGDNPERFAAVFARLGRITPPAARVTQAVTRPCVVCSRMMAGVRVDAETCSSRCRQRRYRRRALPTVAN